MGTVDGCGFNHGLWDGLQCGKEEQKVILGGHLAEPDACPELPITDGLLVVNLEGVNVNISRRIEGIVDFGQHRLAVGRNVGVRLATQVRILERTVVEVNVEALPFARVVAVIEVEFATVTCGHTGRTRQQDTVHGPTNGGDQEIIGACMVTVLKATTGEETDRVVFSKEKVGAELTEVIHRCTLQQHRLFQPQAVL